MKYWTYVEYGKEGKEETRTLSEAQIIKQFFPWWSKRMREADKGHLINHQNCIDDWVVINWAWRGKKNDSMAKERDSRESEPRSD